MNNREFEKVFNEVYRKVVVGAVYSIPIGNQIGYNIGIKACEMPREITARLEQYGGGCCFHHSWRLIHELSKVGIKAYFAAVPELNENGRIDNKAIVVYENADGNRYVADVTEDIKEGVTEDDFVQDTCKWINKKGEIVNHTKIGLQEIANSSNNEFVSGYLRIYPQPNNKVMFIEWLKEYEEILAEGSNSGKAP